MIEAGRHLRHLASTLDEVSADADRLTRSLGEGQRLWRPAPERWGVADCFEHLIATGDAYYPRVRAALDEGLAAGPSSHYRPRLFGRLFIWASGPDGRLRIRTRGVFTPPPPAADAPERFLSQQPTLRALIDEAARADLQRPRVTSPLTPMVTLTLGEALHMLVVHQQRHLGQAHRVRAEPGFPTS